MSVPAISAPPWEVARAAPHRGLARRERRREREGRAANARAQDRSDDVGRVQRHLHRCRAGGARPSNDIPGAAGQPAAVITSLVPSSAAAGEQVTIHGTNFGATQADPNQDYVFFVDGDTSWGAPFEGATFHRDSWSDTAITFTVPTPSGDNGIWHVTPGTTATVPEHVSRALQHRSTADHGIAPLVH